MILNVDFTECKNKVMALAKELLEFMNQPTLIETHRRDNSLMKQHGERVNFPIILVKALVSGNWYNKNVDCP